MPIEKTDIETFLELSRNFPVLDVRSPSEFLHAHIPNAFTLPLFTDDQRKIIGTAYKKQSRKIAVEIGLNYFSERMKSIQKETIKILEDAYTTSDHPSLLVHCWRGGMRSETVAWLLNLYGYQVFVLKGGYKAYRRWTLKQTEKQYNFHILGGYTGSGKTEVLKEMKKDGKAVIDLEGLANHRGSSFGSLGQAPQPSQEMFENLLALELWTLTKIPAVQESGGAEVSPEKQVIWLEDESRHIGSVGFSLAFWEQMQSSPLYFMDVPFEERLNFIVKIYGHFDRNKLESCILNIQKRLGGLETKNALQFLANGEIKECFEILIRYYDRHYGKCLKKRENFSTELNKIPYDYVNRRNAHFLMNK